MQTVRKPWDLREEEMCELGLRRGWTWFYMNSGREQGRACRGS